MKRISIITIALVLALSLVPFSAFAHNGVDHDAMTPEEHATSLKKTDDVKKSGSKEKETEAEKENATETEKSTEVKRERLGVDKLKICQKRQAQVNDIMARVVTRSKASFERITVASERAQAFYVKQGNVLSNYDALVATVTSTKAAAQTAINALSTTSTFTCTSDAPKADIQEFKTHRVQKIDALSAYRDAVKALIKGIKSVQPVETTTSEVKQ